MKYKINICFNGLWYVYPILLNSNCQRIFIPDFVQLDLHKVHVHRYDLYAYFFKSKRIIGLRSYRTKRELNGAIQLLLQEELNIDVQ